MIALSFCYLENNDIIQSKIFCRRALSLEPSSTAANRCFGLINLKLYVEKENEPTIKLETSNLQYLQSYGPRSSSNLPSFSSFSSSSSLTLTAMNKETVESSTKYFSLSFQYAYGNPYTLRCSSVSAAIRGRPVEAIKLMEAAMINGSTHSLTVRSLGIMTYLYSSHLDDNVRLQKSINYLFQCLKLTPFGSIPDLEAFLLLGQLLIEAKQFLKAKEILKQALKISPSNVLLLSSLGIALSYLPYHENVRTDEMYRQEILSLTKLEDLSELEDPGSLFFSSINPELINILKLKNFIKNNDINENKNNDDVDNEKFQSNDEKSNFTAKNAVKKNEIFPFVFNPYLSDVYYSYGIFFLKKGSLEGIQNAKKMFTLAISSTMIEENTKKSLAIDNKININCNNFHYFREGKNDQKTTKHHPLSVYMLGWSKI